MEGMRVMGASGFGPQKHLYVPYEVMLETPQAQETLPLVMNDYDPCRSRSKA